MRLSDPFQNPKLKVFTNFHGGGGGGTPKVKPLNIPAPPPVVLPPMPKPAPPPPPPPTTSQLEVEEAAEQQRRDAANRKGMSASLLAGETGGQQNTATGNSSLLGAGNAQAVNDPVLRAAYSASALSPGASIAGTAMPKGKKKL